MTEKAKKALAPDGWDEEKAIADGHFFTDVFGVKHGLRTTSDDGMAAANPVAQDEKDAQAAFDLANATRETALAAYQEGLRQDGRAVAVDMNTGKGFMMFSKRRATPATIEELKAAFSEADD